MSLKYDGKSTLAAGIVLLTVGIFAVVFGFIQRENFDSIKRWPVVNAAVTKVYENYYERDNISYTENYTIHLRFMVDNKFYYRAFTIEVYSDEGFMNLLYNPKNPTEAYLASDPPESGDYYFYGVIFLGLGFAVFFNAFERKKKQKTKSG